MTERLNEAVDGESIAFFLRTCVYPKLLLEAGQPMGPMGVATLVETAIGTSIMGVPTELEDAAYKLAPKLIDALVIDEKVARAAKEWFVRNRRCEALF